MIFNANIDGHVTLNLTTIDTEYGRMYEVRMWDHTATTNVWQTLYNGESKEYALEEFQRWQQIQMADAGL